jgi:hypothetical protein
MSDFVEIPVSADALLLVERDTGDEIVAAGRVRDVAQAGLATLDDALGGLRAAAERVVCMARDAIEPPQEVTVEFAVQLASEAGVVVARTSATANLKVAFRWELGGGSHE